MRAAVIEVHRGGDGVWEANERPVFGSDDVDVIEDLERYETKRVRVRIAGEVKELTVYLEGDGGFVKYEEAYAQA